MDKQKFKKLVSECKPLLKQATPEQKIKILKMIKEGYNRLSMSENNQKTHATQVVDSNKDLDYLEEK